MSNFERLAEDEPPVQADDTDADTEELFRVPVVGDLIDLLGGQWIVTEVEATGDGWTQLVAQDGYGTLFSFRFKR